MKALVLTTALMTLTLACAGLGSSPGSTVKKFTRAMYDGDADAVAACLTDDMAARTKRSDFKEGIASLSKQAKEQGIDIDHLTIDQEKVTGETAEVRFTTPTKAGSEKGVAYLKHVQGQWLIWKME